MTKKEIIAKLKEKEIIFSKSARKDELERLLAASSDLPTSTQAPDALVPEPSVSVTVEPVPEDSETIDTPDKAISVSRMDENVLESQDDTQAAVQDQDALLEAARNLVNKHSRDNLVRVPLKFQRFLNDGDIKWIENEYLGRLALQRSQIQKMKKICNRPARQLALINLCFALLEGDPYEVDRYKKELEEELK